jgi:putative sigma-54 modulation protein
MNVSITFRHVDSSDALKNYAEEKVSKLQKFLRQPMTAKVTLSVDRLKQAAEVQISSGGQHIEAKESTGDMYASIDLVIGKLERQIRGIKGAAQARRRGAETVRVSTAAVLTDGSAVASLRGRAKKAAAKVAPTQRTTASATKRAMAKR